MVCLHVSQKESLTGLMRRTAGKSGFLLFMAGAVIFSLALFWACYNLDNKYTAGGPQPERGVLVLSEAQLEKYPVVFLVHGWEIHRDRLLAPEDFSLSAGGVSPDEFVFIGQYGGFEGSNPKRSPHGSATYRLSIDIPSEPAAYTLELPEIYSAYTLYINGVKAQQFGEPNPAHYRPETGMTSVSFLAQNSVEIIVAVSDFSHTYSGMVYPPAFGLSHAVSTMLDTRLAVRAAVSALALALAVFFLALGFLMRNDRTLLLFGALCLCFVGFVCYPLVKSMLSVGMWWYGFENLCFCALLLLVMLLQRVISGDKSRLSLVFIGFALVVCACSLLRFALPAGNLSLMTAYSLLIGLYKWAAAFFLTVSLIRSAGRNTRYGLTMLAGVVVFDVGLVLDRLLPLFEPIRFGWFAEISGFALVVVLGVVVGQEALRHYQNKLVLEGKVAGIENLLEMQRAYYPVLMESVEQARHARHDLRHHIGVIQGLLAAGKQNELAAYVQDYAAELSRLTPLTFCENDIADVILRQFATLAEQEGIRYEVDAALPASLPLDNADLCTILSNLLENAVEANAYVAGDKSIRVTIKQVKSSLIMLVDNSFDGSVRKRGSMFLSRKQHNREGLGLASIQSVVTQLGGSASFTPNTQEKIFTSEVILPFEQ